MPDKLFLHQELLLLAIRDDQGTFSGGMYLYAVGGAMVSELLIQQRIIANDEKKQVVAVIDDSSTGDAILDELLGLIGGAKKNRGMQHWVSKAAHLPKLQHRVAQQLCDAGILQRDEKKVLWLFTHQVYPELDGSVEDGIRAKMAKVMFDEQAKPDPQTAVLIALGLHAGLLRSNFAKDELSQHKVRIKKIASGDVLATGATQATIQAVQAAILMAAVLPAMTAATMSH
ncbi:MAG: GPP34 family phosphoprotein [Mariniblastus sp.]|nr:GPP34 family phosphoprotein [Mariniblastus sp.]